MAKPILKRSTEATVDSISKYLEEVLALPVPQTLRCYRGQVNSEWKPQPSIMRGYSSDAESAVISELLTESPEDFSGDTSMFEKLVRAQHYHLPTRLLDVSLNPLVGLFFACFDQDQTLLEKDAKIFIFDFNKDRVKFYDSDTISLICNLARLSDAERGTLEREASSASSAEEIQEFRSLEEMKRLVHFVRTEKSYFLNEVNPVDLRKYFAVLPRKNNRRIVAQSGAFIASGLLQYLSLDKSKAIKTTKFLIPCKSKLEILEGLDTLNINQRTMFPEMENASNYIKAKWRK